MRLSCQEQLLPGDSLEEKWAATGAGFEGIELRARGDGHFASRLPELRAAVRAGVVMATVCPETDHFIGDFDPDRRRDAVTQLRSQLSVIAELGGTGVLTPASWGMFSLRLPPFIPPRQPRTARCCWRRSWSWPSTPPPRACGWPSSRSTATRTTWSTASRRRPGWPRRSSGRRGWARSGSAPTCST